MIKNLTNFCYNWLYLKPIVLYKISKIVGIKNVRNFYPYLLELKSQSGIYLKYVVLLKNTKPLIIKLHEQDYFSINFNPSIILLDTKQKENLLPSNSIILFVRQRKLSLTEINSVLNLFRYKTHKTSKFETDKMKANKEIVNFQNWETIKLSQRRTNKVEVFWNNGNISFVEKKDIELSNLQKKLKTLSFKHK